MKIRKIAIEEFGKLQDFQMELKDGLHVIYGRNESGKTTLIQYIKAMLYGFNNNKKSISENYRKKYSPWGGTKASGSLYIQDQENTYRIKRTFGERKSDDKIEIIHNTTGESIDLKGFLEPGQLFFGIEAATYEKTLFISQLSSKISQTHNDEIIEHLSNLRNSGELDVSYDKAMKQLESHKKSIVNTNRAPGRLDRLKEEYDKVIIQKHRIEDMKEAWEEREAPDIHVIQSEIDNLEGSNFENLQEEFSLIKDNLAKLKGIYEIIEDKKIEEKAIREEYQDILSKSGFFYFDNKEAGNDLKSLIEKNVWLDTYREKNELHLKVIEEMNLLGHKKSTLEKKWNLEQWQEDIQSVKKLLETEDKLKIEEYRLKKNIRSAKILGPREIGIMAGSVFLALLSILLFDFNVIAIGAGCLFIAISFIFIQNRQNQNINQLRKDIQHLPERIKGTHDSIERILRRYDANNVEGLTKRFYDFQSEIREIEGIIKEKGSQCFYYEKLEYEKLIHEAEEATHQILEKYESQSIDELKERIEDLQASGSRKLRLEEIIQHRSIATEKLMATMEETTNKVVLSIGQYYDRLLIQLEDEMDLLRNKMDLYEKELRATTKAIEVLEKSFFQFHMSFSSNLNERSNKILKLITRKNYSGILVSKDFDVKIAHDDIHEVRSIDYYSNGTWDQIYFSIRMGIFELLRERINKSLPLLLDDAFVQYDDERLQGVLDYLVEYGKENQILLLTCQKREVEYLMQKQYADVNIVELPS